MDRGQLTCIHQGLPCNPDGADNSGNDLIYGFGGDDNLNGGNGIDTMLGGDGNDTISGGDGIDFLYGEAGDDTIFGDNGNDYLFGDAGNDNLRGGDGNDYLFGDAGDDFLFGNDGKDTLTGGLGADTFLPGDNSFSDNASTDVITDFSTIQGDLLLVINEFVGVSSINNVGIVGSDADVATSAKILVYSSGSGTVFYNKNGADAGFGDVLEPKLATLLGAPTLALGNFV
jgi:Ca2+-binding RTX toxin-like protein